MNKKLLINLAVFGALAVVLWFITWPAWGAFSAARKEVSIKQKAVEAERQAVAKLNSANRVLESQRANVGRLEEAIPALESKPELISILENLASQSGLNPISINVTSPQGGPGVKSVKKSASSNQLISGALTTLRADLIFVGTYGAFRTWLEAAEKNLRLLDVITISFNVGGGGNTSGGDGAPAAEPSANFNVAVNTYVLEK